MQVHRLVRRRSVERANKALMLGIRDGAGADHQVRTIDGCHFSSLLRCSLTGRISRRF